MNESRRRFPKVQYRVPTGIALVCYVSNGSRTHGVISPHPLYSLENYIKVPMNCRTMQVWKIRVVGEKQVEPTMGGRRGQLREPTPAVLTTPEYYSD